MSSYSEVNLILAADRKITPVIPVDDKKSIDGALIHPDDKKIGDECTCGVCNRIYPVFLACSICTYRLCTSCRYKWPSKCPGCRQSSTFDSQHPKFDFRVKCEHPECKEYITLGIQHAAYYRHVSECKYSTEECKQCRKQIYKYERENHYADHLPVRCDYCHTFIEKSKLKEHQLKDGDLPCKGWMFCPNGCCQYNDDALSLVDSSSSSEKKRIRILCSNLENHLRACRYRLMKCKVCKTIIQSNQLETHLKEHSLALISNFLQDSIDTKGPSIDTKGPSIDTKGPSIDTKGPSIEVRLYRDFENYGVKCQHDLSDLVPFFRTVCPVNLQNNTINIDSFRPDHIEVFRKNIERPMLFFSMVERKNGTYRIGQHHQIITGTSTQLQLNAERINKQHSFWVVPYDDVVMTGDDCLLFLKYINSTGEIIFAGTQMFNRAQKINTIKGWYFVNFPLECMDGNIIEEIDPLNNIWNKYDLKSSIADLKVCTGDTFVCVPKEKKIQYDREITINFYPDPCLGLMDMRLHAHVLVGINDTCQEVINKLRTQLNLDIRDYLYLYPMTPIRGTLNKKFIQLFREKICLSSGIPYMTSSLMKNSMTVQYRYPLVASYFSRKDNTRYKLARFIVPNKPLDQIMDTIPDGIFVERCGVIIDRYMIDSKKIPEIPYLRSEIYSNPLDQRSVSLMQKYQFLDVDIKTDNFYYPVQQINNVYKIIDFPITRDMIPEFISGVNKKINSRDESKLTYAKGIIDFETGEIMIGIRRPDPIDISINETGKDGIFSAIVMPSDLSIDVDSKEYKSQFSISSLNSTSSSLSSSSLSSSSSSLQSRQMDIENISKTAKCSMYIAEQAYDLVDQSPSNAIKLILSGALSN